MQLCDCTISAVVSAKDGCVLKRTKTSKKPYFCELSVRVEKSKKSIWSLWWRTFWAFSYRSLQNGASIFGIEMSGRLTCTWNQRVAHMICIYRQCVLVESLRDGLAADGEKCNALWSSTDRGEEMAQHCTKWAVSKHRKPAYIWLLVKMLFSLCFLGWITFVFFCVFCLLYYHNMDLTGTWVLMAFWHTLSEMCWHFDMSISFLSRRLSHISIKIKTAIWLGRTSEHFCNTFSSTQFKLAAIISSQRPQQQVGLHRKNICIYFARPVLPLGSTALLNISHLNHFVYTENKITVIYLRKCAKEVFLMS